MKNILIGTVLIAAAWGANLALASTARAGDAPSEIPAPPKPGKVKFSHEARKVVACEKVTEEGEPTQCKASQFEPAKSGAKVKLNPIEEGNTATAQPRAAVSVDLVNDLGKQTRELQIDAGAWELVWQGSTVLRDKFSVQPGDEFEIEFSTELGVCRLKDDQCVLDKDKKQQGVEIPTERGL